MNDNNNRLQRLPVPPSEHLDRLVENRTVYTAQDFELNIFDTFEKVENFQLSFGDLALVSMITGEKKMRLNAEEPFRFLPGQSAWLSEETKMNIDFPKASIVEPSQCAVVLFQKSKINQVLDFLNENSPKSLNPASWSVSNTEKLFENSPELAELLNRFFRCCMSTDSYKEALANIRLVEILIKVMHAQELLAIEKNTDANSSPVQFIKNFIERNLSENITLQTLSQKVNMSSSSLYRRFKDELGISPMEFIQNIRIKEAKKLLKKGFKVKDVANEVGIFDDNYFIRIFKKHTGTTPGSFIDQSNFQTR